MRIIQPKTDLAYAGVAVTTNSAVIPLENIVLASIRPEWTAGFTGSVKLQRSIDGISWDDVSGATSAIAGLSGSVVWDLVDITYYYARVVMTRTAGSANFDIKISAKGV